MADDNSNSRQRKKIRKPQSSAIQMIDTTETKKTRKKRALQEDTDDVTKDPKATTNSRRKKNVEEKRAKLVERETAFASDHDDQEKIVPKSIKKKKKRTTGQQMADNSYMESGSRASVQADDHENKDGLKMNDSFGNPDVVDGDTTKNEERSRKKKGKKRKDYQLTSAAAVSHYSEADFDHDLNLSPEDVITSKDYNIEITEPPNLVPSLPSQPLNVVYVERTDGGGFRRINKSNLNDMKKDKDIDALKSKMSNITNSAQLGSSVFNIFMKIAFFCEGLLAGFALWQTISISTIENQVNGTITVLACYNRLSQAAQSVYYFLLAIATVSVMDRFDLESHEYVSLITRFIRHPVLALCILIHILSLILSTSIAEIDYRIGLYNVNQSFYWPTVTDQNVRRLTTQSQTLFSSWRIINLLRGILAIAGWMLVSFNPITAIPEKYLYGRKNDILGEDIDV
ncbi:Transmembrane protein 237 [Trichoplax sp. H2]|nr:Transmembrane protein 237 [Trichoplax sp. H2]|eukprot:RDD43851.1 Transmembrane protein 237 [Trichoplax sp. H2]